MELLTILLEIGQASQASKKELLPLVQVWVWVSIGGSALEAMARQPEIAGDIRSNMIVAAALVEGVPLSV